MQNIIKNHLPIEKSDEVIIESIKELWKHHQYRVPLMKNEN